VGGLIGVRLMVLVVSFHVIKLAEIRAGAKNAALVR
jgi:hypothetical protein